MIDPSRSSLFTWRSFLSHLLLGAMIGLPIGTLLFWLTDTSNDPHTIVLTTNIGVLIGFLTWLSRAADESSASATARRAARREKRAAKRSSAPFARRLAQYTGCEEELNQAQPNSKSKMTFWSLIDFRTWRGGSIMIQPRRCDRPKERRYRHRHRRIRQETKPRLW